MSTGFGLPQRGNAYQPRVQPWGLDGGYGDAPVWGLGRAGLVVGAVRYMSPMALPWVVIFCPVGAGIAHGHHHPSPGNPSTIFIVSTLTTRLQAR